MTKVVNARDYSFPKSLVLPSTWLYAPNALPLSDAVNDMSQHEERTAWEVFDRCWTLCNLTRRVGQRFSHFACIVFSNSSSVRFLIAVAVALVA